MATNEKARQKKLAKKKQKRKLVAKSRQMSSAMLIDNPAQYANLPIFECIVSNGLFEIGLGTIIIARRTPTGMIAVASFIVDVFCLGVKNTLFTVKSAHEYATIVKPRLIENHEEGCENVSPAYAKKVLEGAVDYAAELGFPPHHEFKDTKVMLNNIDVAECETDFIYGKDGKPCYFQGPHESPSQIQEIIKQLHDKCGEGNYHYTAML